MCFNIPNGQKLVPWILPMIPGLQKNWMGNIWGTTSCSSQRSNHRKSWQVQHQDKSFSSRLKLLQPFPLRLLRFVCITWRIVDQCGSAGLLLKKIWLEVRSAMQAMRNEDNWFAAEDVYKMLNIAKRGKTIPFDWCMFRNGWVAGLLNILFIYGLVVVVVFPVSAGLSVSGDVEFKAVIVRLSSDVGDPRSSFGKFASN